MKTIIRKGTLLGLFGAMFVLALPAHAFYDPSLARWINRDPIGELSATLLATPDTKALIQETFQQALMPARLRPYSLAYSVNMHPTSGTATPSTIEIANLDGFVLNDPLNNVDAWGLVSLPPGWTGPGQPYNPSCNPFAGPPPPCAGPAALVATVCGSAVIVCAKKGIRSPACQAVAGACAGAWLIFKACITASK